MSNDERGQLFQINGDSEEVRARMKQTLAAVSDMRETVLRNKTDLEGFKDIGGLANCVESLQNIANIMGNAYEALAKAEELILYYIEALEAASKVQVDF